MRRKRSATRVTWQALTIAGALLLADGQYVPMQEMQYGLFPWEVSERSIWNHIYNLRRFGMEIHNRPLRGYRMMRVPPDEHLESLLAILPSVKRSAWWAMRFGSQIQRTA